MIKMCIIGDSHIGAVKIALQILQNRNIDEISPTYFAGTMQSLTMRGRTLTKKDGEDRKNILMGSNGQDSIEVDDYDCFLIAGMGFGIGPSHPNMLNKGLMLRLYRRFYSDSMPGPSGNKYRLSDECFLEAAEGLYGDCVALQVAEMIRRLCDKPIFLSAVPNPGAGVPEANLNARFASFYQATRNGDADALGILFGQLTRRLSVKLNINVIPPPGAAASNGVFNRREFSKLPESFSHLSRVETHMAVSHGNERYGMLVWQSVISELVKLSLLDGSQNKYKILANG